MLFKKGKTENYHALYFIKKCFVERRKPGKGEREVFDIVCERVNKILKNLVTKN